MGLVSHHLRLNLQLRSCYYVPSRCHRSRVPPLRLLWAHTNAFSTTCPLPGIYKISDISEATAVSTSPKRIRMYLHLHQGYHNGEHVILLPGKLHQLFSQSAGASCIPPEAQPLQNPDAHLQCFTVTVRQGWIYHSTIFAHTGNLLFMQDNNQAESNKRLPVEYYDMVSAPSFVDYRNPLTAMCLLKKSQCQQAEGIQVQHPVLIHRKANPLSCSPSATLWWDAWCCTYREIDLWRWKM